MSRDLQTKQGKVDPSSLLILNILHFFLNSVVLGPRKAAPWVITLVAAWQLTTRVTLVQGFWSSPLISAGYFVHTGGAYILSTSHTYRSISKKNNVLGVIIRPCFAKQDKNLFYNQFTIYLVAFVIDN